MRGSVVCALVICGLARAQTCVSLSGISAYTENFDTLANTGTGSTVPPGWAFSESGTAANTTYTAGTGSSTTGDTYSFGAAGSTDRALGGLQSGSLVPTIGACFTNNTGGSIVVKVSYTGEQWRLGATGRADRLDFQYSTNAVSISDAAANWIDLNALDFSSPATTGTVGALDGNASHTILPATTITAVDPGATLYVRWTSFDANGGDDGLAIDDFTLTPAAGVNPSQPVTSNGTGCTFTPGNFPSWLSLTGVTGSGFTLAGTAVAGSYTFTVNADCTNGTGSATYSLLVFVPLTCGGAKTAIHTIQGQGSATTMGGSIVEIEGIVTGSYQDASAGLGGFFIQEPDSEWDADPLTSEGLFVFDSGFGVPVAMGDRVRVKGTATDFNSGGSSLTELNSVTAMQVCSTGNDFTRSTVSLPVAALADWERYEGMAVRFTQPLVVTGNFNLGQFGQVDLAPSVLVQPTQAVAPGAAAVAMQDLNDRSRIQLDDGSEAQNPFPLIFPPAGLSAIPASRTLRTGDGIGYRNASNQPIPFEAILDHRHGAYRVIPIDPSKVTWAALNPRPGAVRAPAGRFTVASANLNNFFVGPFPTARGADSQAEFDRQLPKTVASLCGLNADVIAINELENNDEAAMTALITALNATSGCGPYTPISTGTIGTDLIRSAIIFKPASVTPVGAYAVLDLPLPELNRPTLAQTFRPSSGPKPEKQYFTVVTNHYKARSSSANCDADANDGQDSCNTMRLNMAYHVVCWLYGGCAAPYVYPGNPTGDTTPAASRRYLLLGDFNGYLQEDPFRAMGDPTFSKAGTARYPAGWPANPKADFIDMIDTIIGPAAYSYNFGSQNGYLDHALANLPLRRLISTIVEWHVNADEPTVFDYNLEFKTTGPTGSQTVYYAPDPYRNSDHDPFVVGLNPLPGDLNDDGTVDANDGKLLQQNIGKEASDVDRRMDFDGDGKITTTDFRLWHAAQRAWNGSPR